MTKNDWWSLFLLGLYAFTLPRVVNAIQVLQALDPQRFSQSASAATLIRFAATALVTYFFFNGLWKTIQLGTSTEADQIMLRSVLRSTGWLLGFVVLVSVLPQF